MGHNQNILGAFQFHDDGLETDHNITVRFTATVSVVVFVVIAGLEIFGVLFFDLGVGEAIADAGIEFVQGFPLELVVGRGKETGG